MIKEKTVHLISVYDKAEYDTAKIDLLLKILKDKGL